MIKTDSIKTSQKERQEKQTSTYTREAAADEAYCLDSWFVTAVL
jgi:hypothetical protein